MIDRDGTWIEIACDECGELTGDAYDRDDFGPMISAAKRADWTIEPTRGGWSHICPFCQSTPSIESSFDDEPTGRTFDPDIEAILGPSKDHER